MLFLLDTLYFTTRIMNVNRNTSNPLNGEHPEITELIDYEMFCGVTGNGERTLVEEEGEQGNQMEKSFSSGSDSQKIPEISVLKLKEWLDRGEDIQVIDVREPYEHEIAEIGGELIPMKIVSEHVDNISRIKKVVIHCRSGQRSADTVRELRKKFGFENVYNLKGGILAWSDEIDPEVPKY